MSVRRKGTRPAASTGPPVQFSATISRFLRSSSKQPQERVTPKMADPARPTAEQRESLRGAVRGQGDIAVLSQSPPRHSQTEGPGAHQAGSENLQTSAALLAGEAVQGEGHVEWQTASARWAEGRRSEEVHSPFPHSDEVEGRHVAPTATVKHHAETMSSPVATYAQPTFPRPNSEHSLHVRITREEIQHCKLIPGSRPVPMLEGPNYPVGPPLTQDGAIGGTPSHNICMPTSTISSGPQIQIAPGGEEWDTFKSRIFNIPTKEELQEFVSKLEVSFKAAAETLRGEVSDLSVKVSRTDTAVVLLSDRVQTLENQMALQTSSFESYVDSLEDLENRERRQNIRVRGLPESVQTGELNATLQGLFNSVRNAPLESTIEFDRAHRSLGPPPSRRGPP